MKHNIYQKYKLLIKNNYTDIITAASDLNEIGIENLRFPIGIIYYVKDFCEVRYPLIHDVPVKNCEQ